MPNCSEETQLCSSVGAVVRSSVEDEMHLTPDLPLSSAREPRTLLYPGRVVQDSLLSSSKQLAVTTGTSISCKGKDSL